MHPVGSEPIDHRKGLSAARTEGLREHRAGAPHEAVSGHRGATREGLGQVGPVVAEPRGLCKDLDDLDEHPGVVHALGIMVSALMFYLVVLSGAGIALTIVYAFFEA